MAQLLLGNRCLRIPFLNRRLVLLFILLLGIVTTTILTTEAGANLVTDVRETWVQPVLEKAGGRQWAKKVRPYYKPTPTWVPPPVKENFPLLTTATPPPIPSWNVANKTLHKSYNLTIAPPLLIGFTRTWPILQQALVSYITAGWPAEHIYVVENTGVQRANAQGKLSLQNPLYLNHEALRKLGVNVIQAPVLMTFAQLQNFFLSISIEKSWPFYYWSHMDVIALSYEDGHADLTPPYDQPGYRSIYELACYHASKTLEMDDHWAIRFFAYDHLALVNPAAYEDVGGWDTLIPYYLTDCDMHSRLAMRNWTMQDLRAGIIVDVNTAIDDLRAFYRDQSVIPEFTDPNPPPPVVEEEKKKGWWGKRDTAAHPKTRRNLPSSIQSSDGLRARDEIEDPNLRYWDMLRGKADHMFHYKAGSSRGRNTWQTGQQGGRGEPYYYPAAGIAEGMEIHIEAGREVYRKKWGHQDCNLIGGGNLSFGDQWLVEQDWS